MTTDVSSATAIDLRDPSATAESVAQATGVQWRIPEAGESTGFSRAALRTAAMALVAGVVSGFFLSRELVPISLSLATLTALVTTFRAWNAVSRWRGSPPNMRLDERGLSWQGSDGVERTIPRDEARWHWIGDDMLTTHRVPALVLLCQNDWATQPAEIHPVEFASAVGKWIERAWRVPATTHLPEEPETKVDAKFELDSHRLRLLIEATDENRARIVEELRARGASAVVPPPGMLAPTRWLATATGVIGLRASAESWIDDETISGPREFYTRLADAIESAACDPGRGAEVSCDTGHRWTARVATVASTQR